MRVIGERREAARDPGGEHDGLHRPHPAASLRAPARAPAKPVPDLLGRVGDARRFGRSSGVTLARMNDGPAVAHGGGGRRRPAPAASVTAAVRGVAGGGGERVEARVPRGRGLVAGGAVHLVVEDDVDEIARAAPPAAPSTGPPPIMGRMPRFMSRLPSPSKTTTGSAGRASATPSPMAEARPMDPIM